MHAQYRAHTNLLARHRRIGLALCIAQVNCGDGGMAGSCASERERAAAAKPGLRFVIDYDKGYPRADRSVRTLRTVLGGSPRGVIGIGKYR